MEWFSRKSLNALVSSIRKENTENMQAVESTFNEVYGNLEELDAKIEALTSQKTAAYLGCSYCGTAYIGRVSETDTQGV